MKKDTLATRNHPDLKPADWENLIKEWQNCRLSQRKFCKLKNLSFHSFSYQRAKLILRCNRNITDNTKQFAEIKITKVEDQLAKPAEPFTVVLPNGIRILAPSNLSLRDLVHSLQLGGGDR